MPRDRRAAALAALLGAWGCGESERPALLSDRVGVAVEGCEQFSYEICDIREAKCQRELFGLMACLRGEDVTAAGPPPVSVMTEELAAARVLEGVDRSTDAEAAADFEAEVRGLEMLGLLEPGLIGNADDVLDVTIQSVAAYYKPSTKEVVIIDRGDPLDDLSSNSTLAHEFVHALQDRRWDLGTFGSDARASSDQSLAITSVVEGEATLYELLLNIAYQGVALDQANYAAAFESMVGYGEELSMNMGSAIMSASSVFPYTYGARFMGQHWLSGRTPELESVFAQPPASSLEVMSAGSLASAPVLEAFDVLPAPLDGHRFVADDVAGAWVTLSRLLELAGSTARVEFLRSVATRWRGDRFWLYQSQDDALLASSAIWWTSWADEDAAKAFRDQVLLFRPAGAAIQVQTVGTRTRVVVTERPEELADWGVRADDALLE
ncbi:MAG: hypothetical protein RL685_2126 [Pseudomonadota bacterium]